MYKVIDGKIYQEIDTVAIKTKLGEIITKVKPFVDGIAEAKKCMASYAAQISNYEKNIAGIIAKEAIDPEVALLVDPEKAAQLGFRRST